jgi:hypothetical protein
MKKEILIEIVKKRLALEGEELTAVFSKMYRFPLPPVSGVGPGVSSCPSRHEMACRPTG